MAFIGYHGSSSAHRASLGGGLRAVGNGAWINAGVSELGAGFYVTTHEATSVVYGIAAVDGGGIVGAGVDIWIVESPVNLADLRGVGVPNDKQYQHITQDLCSEPIHYLYNANERPPSQLKFNDWALGLLSLRPHRRYTRLQAEAAAG